MEVFQCTVFYSVARAAQSYSSPKWQFVTRDEVNLRTSGYLSATAHRAEAKQSKDGSKKKGVCCKRV
eukprot:1161342-Pelagomonas_calceolata.AAC.14